VRFVTVISDSVYLTKASLIVRIVTQANSYTALGILGDILSCVCALRLIKIFNSVSVQWISMEPRRFTERTDVEITLRFFALPKESRKGRKSPVALLAGGQVSIFSFQILGCES
jgi:hypothetical protein